MFERKIIADRLAALASNFILFLIVLLCSCHIASAQIIIAEGTGINEEAARQDAVRNAVEEAAGTYIASKSLVENYQLKLDEIYSQSQGYVTNIEILSSYNEGNIFKIKARIDVDTNPDATLISRLNTIVMLNDPRIAVVVIDKENPVRSVFSTSNVDERSESSNSHDLIVEEALNKRLIDMGFTHVVDANQVARLRNSELLNTIYRGGTIMTAPSEERPIDYLVFGKCKASAYDVRVPDGKGGYKETLVSSGRAILEIRLIDFSTGNIAATFTAEGQGVDNNQELAQIKAKQVAAAEAAKKIEAKFHKVAAKAFSGLHVIVKTQDINAVDQLQQELRCLTGVQNVYFREMNNGQALIEVESVQKPHILAKMLKANSKLNIYVVSINNSELKLLVH